MSPVSGATATKDATRPKAAPRRKRGEGQWALGYREPLNKNEENKKFDDGLNVRQRIIDVYSKRGFDSIDPADLRGRFRWYGLYTQRRPGIDGGKTAILEPEELDDRYFMLRVRIDGGQLSGAQLRTIADISNKYARGTADVTDRQNIQLHWIEIESVPAIWEALEAVGLDTTEACGDTPRVILGCPLAGLDADELIDATPEIDDDPRLVHRRQGVLQPAAQVQDLDQRLRRAVLAPRDQRRRVRGRAAPGDRRDRLRPVGRRRAVHQPDDRPAAGDVRQAGAGARGVGRGRRRCSATTATGGCGTAPGSSSSSRTGARSGSARCWRRSTSATRCPTGRPRSTSTPALRDHIGVHPQKDGLAYVGFAPKVGRLNGDALHAIADAGRASTAAAGCGPPPSRRW